MINKKDIYFQALQDFDSLYDDTGGEVNQRFIIFRDCNSKIKIKYYILNMEIQLLSLEQSHDFMGPK